MVKLVQEGASLYSSAKALGVAQSSGRLILRTFVEEGRFVESKKAREKREERMRGREKEARRREKMVLEKKERRRKTLLSEEKDEVAVKTE